LVVQVPIDEPSASSVARALRSGLRGEFNAGSGRDAGEKTARRR
jgi:hypothetical protein